MTIMERYVLQKGINGTSTKKEKNNLIDPYILEKQNRRNAAEFTEEMEKKILQQIDKSIKDVLEDL